MSMTQTPRMCWNKKDARVPALLGAIGYDTGILFHSMFPFIISELQKMILMCFSSDPFNHRLTQFKDSRKFTNSPDFKYGMVYIPLQRARPIFRYTFLWVRIPQLRPSSESLEFTSFISVFQPLAQCPTYMADIQNMQKWMNSHRTVNKRAAH